MLKKVLLRALIALLVVVAAGAIWAFWPESAAGDVAGLEAAGDPYDATIVRDVFGVPHIFGPTDADVAYGLGFAHSEDDFLTIQQSLLAARGDLASVYGIDAAPNDYMVALLRIWDVVDGGYESELSATTRAVVEAYAAGVNHYAALHPADALVGLFPLTGRDIVAASVHKSPLFFGLERTLAELFEDEPQNTVSPRLDAMATGPDTRFGSNVIAVSPLRSSAGRTHFLSNSHQPWEGPVTWYEASVHSGEGWEMTGALFPGVPVIVVGHNRDLAWSFTVSHGDLVDVYELEVNPDDPNQYRFDGRWLDFERREAPISVRLLGRFRWTVKEEVLWTVYGPAIRRDHGTYAVRYAGMGTLGIYEQLLAMNKARSLEEWREAISAQDGLPTFNVGYADREGHIYFLYNALMPVRDERYDWQQYLPGDTSETLWTEYLPFDALPQVLDPATGFVANSNSTPFAVTGGDDNPTPDRYSATTGIETYLSNRAMRALELLSADDEITADDLRAIKYDQTYHAGSDVASFRERLLDADLPERPEIDEALRILGDWDLTARPDGAGMTLMVTTLWFVNESDDETVEFEPSRLSENVVPDDVLAEAFVSAVTTIADEWDRVDVAWGDANRLVRGSVDLAISGGPDLLHAVYGELTDEARFEGVAGDSYVMLVTWEADGTYQSHSIHQYGSATLDDASPHYADQTELFASRGLKPIWFEESDIRANLEIEYRPGNRPGE